MTIPLKNNDKYFIYLSCSQIFVFPSNTTTSWYPFPNRYQKTDKTPNLSVFSLIQRFSFTTKQVSYETCYLFFKLLTTNNPPKLASINKEKNVISDISEVWTTSVEYVLEIGVAETSVVCFSHMA